MTGEASGDLHGAHLAIALRKLQADVELVGVGGEHMRAAGITLLSGLERVDGIGVLGINQIRKGWANLRTLKHYLQQEAFDAIVLIDNPGMNLRLAKIAARFGHRIIYYIAPQIWAWGRRRIHLIKRVINRVIVILPFEKAIYDEANVPCDYVGHPLLDSMAPTYDQREVRRRLGMPEKGLVIGVLPGSRVHEVETLLPEML
ncbi:MAG: lipid-A-disaccharide synthase, partial [Nitrospirota bacterium]|nr:lipid-A-disaccharide synthase [Nitrospirota bacterium]